MFCMYVLLAYVTPRLVLGPRCGGTLAHAPGFTAHAVVEQPASPPYNGLDPAFRLSGETSTFPRYQH